jgi:hypothetical protein
MSLFNAIAPDLGVRGGTTEHADSDSGEVNTSDAIIRVKI